MKNPPPHQTRGGGELKNNARFWNPTITPSGRNVCGMESNKKKNRRKIKYLIIKGKKYNNGCGTDPSCLLYMKTNNIQFQVKLALYLLFTASN